MITERRFSTPFKPQRRRRWARPALMVLLAALVLWLMSSCHMQGGFPTWDELPKALRGTLVGLGAFFIIGLTWCAALKVKRDDEARMEKSRGCARVRPTNTPPPPEPVDPLGMPFSGIDVASMIRITEALLKQTVNAAMWVESARKTLCRHEQEDMLRLALRELDPVNRCLPELKKALEKQAGGKAL